MTDSADLHQMAHEETHRSGYTHRLMMQYCTSLGVDCLKGFSYAYGNDVVLICVSKGIKPNETTSYPICVQTVCNGQILIECTMQFGEKQHRFFIYHCINNPLSVAISENQTNFPNKPNALSFQRNVSQRCTYSDWLWSSKSREQDSKQFSKNTPIKHLIWKWIAVTGDCLDFGNVERLKRIQYWSSDIIWFCFNLVYVCILMALRYHVCMSRDSLDIRHVIIIMVVIILAIPFSSGLLCSQCETTTASDECMTKAPRATPCEDADWIRSKGVSCMITKIKNIKGEITRFVRGCTAVRVGEGCVEYPNGTLCYETCDTNNCNAASTLNMSVVAVVQTTFLYLVMLNHLLHIYAF